MGQSILGIVGSYRRGGIIDQTISIILDAAEKEGAVTEKVYLLDYHIEFCTNCRQCTQDPGPVPARCIHDDDMAGLIEKIERADALVLGAPVNVGSINALAQRFLERLVGYSYWPWEQPAPKKRKEGQAKKPAVLVTAAAMPALLGKFFTGSLRGLKLGASMMGAKPVATIFVGMAALKEQPRLSDRVVRKARRAGQKLAK